MAYKASRSIPHARHKYFHLPRVLILGGISLLIVMILVFKQGMAPSDELMPSSTLLPEAQLDRALRAGQPTLAFFHSNNCRQCIEMIQIVNDVYPVYADSITLVDIDVYDKQNGALLKRVGLQFIPTLIFYDHTGEAQVSVGVINAEQMHKILTALAEGG